MIYTTYFKLGTSIPGAISIYPKPPSWFPSTKIAEDIVPDDDVYRQLTKHEITKKSFAEYYVKDVLMKHDPEEILKEYDNQTLVGWSADDIYDCRFILMEYMGYYLGNVVHELSKREIELDIRP